MSWLSGIVGTSKLALKGLNWQAWALKIGLALALLIAAYAAGVVNTKQEYAEKEAQRANVRAEQIVKVVEKRIPVIQKQEVVRIETETKIKYIKEKLDEELAKNPDRLGCALSPDELRLYREIAESTRVR